MREGVETDEGQQDDDADQGLYPRGGVGAGVPDIFAADHQQRVKHRR